MSPEALFWTGLALKIALTAGIVVTASVAVERSGPFIGALIASLPTAAGAAYIILAVEHPPAFIAQSAVGSIAANAVTAIFMLIYAALARRQGLLASLLPALLAWLVGAYLIRSVEWTLLNASLLTAAVYAFTIAASRLLRTTEVLAKAVKPGRLEIALRALIVAIFVTVVTTASHQIGSFASGVFAVFPIAMTSFMVILHTRASGALASRTIAHAQVPMLGFVLGFVVLYYTAERIGSWWGLLAHLATCVAWNAVLWLRKQKML